MLLRKPSPSAAAKIIYGLALIPHAADRWRALALWAGVNFFLAAERGLEWQWLPFDRKEKIFLWNYY